MNERPCFLIFRKFEEFDNGIDSPAFKTIVQLSIDHKIFETAMYMHMFEHWVKQSLLFFLYVYTERGMSHNWISICFMFF